MPSNNRISIQPIASQNEIEVCAKFMSSSEPWVTLGRSYAESIQTISDTTKEVYVARVDDQIAGFTILNLNGAFRGYIQTVAVLSAWQGQGIGSQLITFAENRIYQDSPNVFMCVSSFNKRAQNLYRRLGFEFIGELKDYIVAGHSEFLLRKSISPLSTFKK